MAQPMDVDTNNCTDSQETVAEFRAFIAGAASGTINHSSSTNTIDLVKNAVSMLKNLPSCRDAVLEYFGTVFHQYVTKYLSLLEAGTFTITTSTDSDALAEEEIVLAEIQEVLCNFVKRKQEEWAPIISAWCLELLGDISKQYNSHKQVGDTLNDRLQLWTVCGATQTLLDINTQCMICLIYSNTEACVDKLLEMSSQHNKNFDWVIVHVGSLFPDTVINSVLTCGLKEFSANDTTTTTTENRKLGSVVDILGHLTNTHFSEIKREINKLFEWSLLVENDDKFITKQKCAAVPYLLQLASMSPMLLKGISEDTLLSLNAEVILQLSDLATDWWCFFEKGRMGLMELVVNLVLNLDTGVFHVLSLIFEIVSMRDSRFTCIRSITKDFFEFFTCELDLALRVKGQTPPLLTPFYQHATLLEKPLLANDHYISSYAAQLFIILGSYNPQILSSSVAFLLNNTSMEIHIERLFEITTGMNDISFFSNAINLALQNYDINICGVDNDSAGKFHTLWKNVWNLLNYEKSNNLSVKAVSFGLIDNFDKILKGMKDCHNDIATARIIANIILMLVEDFPRPLTNSENVCLGDVICLFFYCCIVYNEDSFKLIEDCALVQKLLTACSLKSNITRNHVYKQLIDTALHPPISPIFGAIVKPDTKALSPLEIERVDLFQDNITHGSTLMVAQSTTSVFHAGIIGKGIRDYCLTSKLPAERIKLNSQQLLNSIRACSLQSNKTIDIEALKKMAAMLVERVTPDSMYNGLQWPDEEFCKYTVERDLHVRNFFDRNPLLWKFLKFLACYKLPLCLCSVLLRAILATLISQWGVVANQGREVERNMSLLDTTSELLGILKLGAILPPPLSGIRDIITYLEPKQIQLVLRECVWTFIRDHTPCPDRFFTLDANGIYLRNEDYSHPTKQYTETLRTVMRDNIEKLGEFYYYFFIAPR